MQEKTERNELILDLFRRGHDLAEIGKFHAVSTSRIKQLINDPPLTIMLDRTRHIYFNKRKRSDADYKLAEMLDGILEANQ